VYVPVDEDEDDDLPVEVVAVADDVEEDDVLREDLAAAALAVGRDCAAIVDVRVSATPLAALLGVRDPSPIAPATSAAAAAAATATVRVTRRTARSPRSRGDDSPVPAPLVMGPSERRRLGSSSAAAVEAL
jgi:hypothetical protein